MYLIVGWAPPTNIAPSYGMISNGAIKGYCESWINWNWANGTANGAKAISRWGIGGGIQSHRLQVIPPSVFGKRCWEIFNRVSPELIKEHYDCLIEPDSGDYFIDPDHKVALQKARQKHPRAEILAMRLNEKGTCGRI